MIGNILDVAKLEANKVDLYQQFVHFRPAFKSIMDLVEIKALEKGLELKCTISPNVPDYVYIDQSRFS